MLAPHLIEMTKPYVVFKIIAFIVYTSFEEEECFGKIHPKNNSDAVFSLVISNGIESARGARIRVSKRRFGSKRFCSTALELKHRSYLETAQPFIFQ